MPCSLKLRLKAYCPSSQHAILPSFLYVQCVENPEFANVPECQRADRTSEAWRRCCGWCCWENCRQRATFVKVKRRPGGSLVWGHVIGLSPNTLTPKVVSVSLSRRIATFPFLRSVENLQVPSTTPATTPVTPQPWPPLREYIQTCIVA